MARLKLPKIPCRHKKTLRAGHLGLHSLYWLVNMGEAWPNIALCLLYGCLCCSTLAVELLVEQALFGPSTKEPHS